jgi:hypothetical protein
MGNVCIYSNMMRERSDFGGMRREGLPTFVGKNVTDVTLHYRLKNAVYLFFCDGFCQFLY